MTTLIVQHAAFGAHETPPGHPEQAGRYTAVEQALAAPDVDGTRTAEAPRWQDESLLLLAHDPDHIQHVNAVAASAADGMVALDPDTTMGPSSLEAALRAVGGACRAVDEVAQGHASNAFVVARPPGHHAVRDRSMGFCVFNTAALAALHARRAHGLNRIAIVDFDVHHGNGTQDILDRDADAFFASSHEWPQYPGTGRADERGPAQNCHNAPLAPGTDGAGFQRVWGEALLPALDAFAPDIIVVSAGFDAHEADPLGGLNLREADYGWITDEILALADRHCEGRVVSLLEGGYDLDALASSAATHVKTLATGAQPR